MRSTGSSGRSGSRDDEKRAVLADIDRLLAGERSPAEELVAQWQSQRGPREAAAVLGRALDARNRFATDRTPLPAPSGLPLPPL